MASASRARSPISKASEIEAATRAAAALLDELSKFPTTLADDEAMLIGADDGGVAPRLIAALNYRVTLKRLIASSVAAFEAMAAHVGDVIAGDDVLKAAPQAATWLTEVSVLEA